ncbi:MAG: hypothetical protein EOM15_11150 [Spirochaetia bacterium]|nr:hypothetical protein [Spirochaetia bacterium]
MIWFYCKRSLKDVLGHAILIFFPLVLIFFFDYLYRNVDIETGLALGGPSRITTLSIGFALTFQIYGSAISFETLAEDVYGPMRNRLFASPIETRSLLLAVLVSSAIVSMVQTTIIMLFSRFVLGALYPRLPLIILILLISVVFNQLLGTVILLLSKGVKLANTVTMLYGSIAPMLAGLYFPLPKNTFFRFIQSYGTPMNLANKASLALMDEQVFQAVPALLALLVLTFVLLGILKPLSRGVQV